MSVKKQIYFLVNLSNGEIERYNCTERQMVHYLEEYIDDDINFDVMSDSIAGGDIRIFKNEVGISCNRKIEVKLKEID